MVKKEVKASAKAGGKSHMTQAWMSAPKAKAKPAAKVGAKARAKRVEVSDMTERLMHVQAHVPPRDEEVGHDSAPSVRLTIELPRVMAEPLRRRPVRPSFVGVGRVLEEHVEPRSMPEDAVAHRVYRVVEEPLPVESVSAGRRMYLGLEAVHAPVLRRSG
jgi:hypothetical protein